MALKPQRVSLWLVLAMITALVLAACGGGGNNTPTTGGNNTATVGTGQTGVGTATTGTDGANATGSPTTQTGATPQGTGTSAVPTQGGTVPAATTGTGANATVVTGECPESAQGAQITYWNGFSGEDGPFMTQIVDRFNKENKRGIKVTQTIQPFPEYYAKLEAAQTSQTLPDVAQIHFDQIGTRAARELIRPIPQEVQTQIGLTEANYPERLWNGTVYNGERYSYPLDINGIVMYYNKQAVKGNPAEKNLTGGKPLTREQFEQLVQATNKGGKLGWPITQGFPNTAMFSTLLYQFGGSLFNEDATQATWNSAAGEQALTYLRDMQKRFSGGKPLAQDDDLTLAEQGKTGVIWNGTWLKPRLTGQGKPTNGTAIPQIGDKYAVALGSHTLAMPTQPNDDPAKTAAAGCFIGFVVQNSLPWVEGGGHIPAVNQVRESQAFQKMEPQSNYRQMAEAAVFPPQLPGISEALGPNALEGAVINVLSGKTQDVKGALDEAANRGNQILQENREEFGE